MKILHNICFSFFAVVAVSAVASAVVVIRPSAAGKGVTAGETKTKQPEERQFSFRVQTNPDGTVSGQATLVDPEAEGASAGEPYSLELDISCMHVVDNVAFFGGTTARTTDADLVDAAYFSVQDNGEGIDKISKVYFFDDDPATVGDPQLCMDNQPGDFPMEPIVSGSIALK